MGVPRVTQESEAEILRIRGFRTVKHETRTIRVKVMHEGSASEAQVNHE